MFSFDGNSHLPNHVGLVGTFTSPGCILTLLVFWDENQKRKMIIFSKWIFILLLVSFYSIWPSSYHSVHHTSCLILVSLFIDDGSQDIKSCIGVIFIFTLCPSENPYKPNVYLIWLSRIWYAWYLLSCIIFPSIFSSLHGINYFPLYLIIKNINYLTFVSSKDQCHRRSVSI